VCPFDFDILFFVCIFSSFTLKSNWRKKENGVKRGEFAGQGPAPQGADGEMGRRLCGLCHGQGQVHPVKPRGRVQVRQVRWYLLLLCLLFPFTPFPPASGGVEASSLSSVGGSCDATTTPRWFVHHFSSTLIGGRSWTYRRREGTILRLHACVNGTSLERNLPSKEVRSEGLGLTTCGRCQRLFKECADQVHRPRKKRQVKPS
jgi:hypothetical protein